MDYLGLKKFKLLPSASSWDWTGTIYLEFPEHGQTVNSERYVETA